MQQLFLMVVAGMSITPAVFACSTCMVGDPTQTLMGVEKPYQDRLRMSLDGLVRKEELGREGFNKKEIDESRATLSFSYAPNTRYMFGLAVPFARRKLSTFNLAEQEVTAPGDMTLTVKSFQQEKQFMQKHMYGFLAGIKIPTGSEQTDVNGAPLDFDVQSGQGAVVVNVGAWYANFNFPYMYYLSAAYYKANEGFQGFQAGDALVFNAAAQYAKSTDLSFSFALEGRWSQRDSFSGVSDPDSGGAIVFASPGVIYTLKQDVLFNIFIKTPVVDALNGFHDEGAIFTMGITYDFDMH